MIVYNLNPQKALVCAETRVYEPLLVVVGPKVWPGSEAKSTKKERTKSRPTPKIAPSQTAKGAILGVGLLLDRRPPPRRRTSTKFCVPGRIPDIFLGFEFQKDRLENVGAVEVEILASPLTTLIAYRPIQRRRQNWRPRGQDKF